MTSSIELLRVDLFDQIAHLCTLRSDAERQPLAQQLIQALYESVPPADLVAERPEHLLESAQSLLEFIEQRQPGEAKVRLTGDGSDRCVLELVTDDMPFLTDSVRGCLQRQGIGIRLLMHPVVEVKREGPSLQELVSVRAGGLGAAHEIPSRESVMHIWIERIDEGAYEPVIASVKQVLADVRMCIEDHKALRRMCERMCAEQRRSSVNGAIEAAELLEWLQEDHFVFMGYSYARIVDAVDPGRQKARRFDRDPGLGILRDSRRSLFDVFEPPPKQEAMRILKASRHSTVHRTAPLDALLLPVRDQEGETLGAHLLVGLFTAAAYACPLERVPPLRHKMLAVLARAQVVPKSHDERLLRYILQTYPRDDLFQISTDDLFSIALGVFHLQNRPRVALFVRKDPFGRYVSCLVYVPRERMDTDLRNRIQALLCDAFRGEILDYSPQLGSEPLARLQLTISTPHGTRSDLDFGALERKLTTLTLSWYDRLARALPGEQGRREGMRLAARYRDAFPAGYRAEFDAFSAITDIESIEEALAKEALSLQVFRDSGAGKHELTIKVFSPAGPMPLSDVLPILENLGLRVLSEVPNAIHPEGVEAPVWLHTYGVELEGKVAVDPSEVAEAFVEAFTAIWQGESENDGFHKLVLHAGLGVRQVLLLRSYAQYLRQLQVPFSLPYVQQTLREQPSFARLLVKMFSARFKPDQADASLERQLRRRFDEALDSVTSLDQDRILRLFAEAIAATVRTDFYQRGADEKPKPHLALKLHPKAFAAVPKPRPDREIFVSGPRMEGVHLRFGAVSRGGLRWSDRQEDFRTEVLGLVKAQQVKNAVIVPVGSKGGFVIKRPLPSEAGRDAQRAQGIECYKLFISALLDLTDDVDRQPASGERDSSPDREALEERIRRPERTVVHDAPDPYLVVAADKGTATFSDIANELSVQRGFWLGDAFASGGSDGYDHKRMAITARGAWESIKRHFRELGKNVQSELFSCVGCGDMSGDVFGNALLLSPHTRLVGAFDHRHIFLDPSPDAASSFRERKRLFSMPRSSWDDYDRSLISEGGGVFSRRAKHIVLSAEARQRLGVAQESLSPAEVITALLRCEVELLFFGGIGTYIKASSENDAEVSDRANDSLRVDAQQVRARVIGEGANLGLTQAARIEYCLNGGRCNTDFIDNSAGVDCSDHEVNIKILLAEQEQAGGLTRPERNALLRQMEEEVAELVLRDNYDQTLCVSLCQRLQAGRIFSLQEHLSRSGLLDSKLESLPSAETLSERALDGQGFTRPELCVLVAYCKNAVRGELLEEGMSADSLLAADLVGYFPGALVERYPKAPGHHRLQRELLATLQCNAMINRMGPTFPLEVRRTSGASAGQLVMAYRYAVAITGHDDLWRGIETLDNQVRSETQLELFEECMRLLERLTVWLLREHEQAELSVRWQRYRNAFRALEETLSDWVAPELADGVRSRAQVWQQAGVPEAMAQRVAQQRLLLAGGDLARIAELSEAPLDHAARTYLALGQRFKFNSLRRAAITLKGDRAWDRQALATVYEELFVTQRALTLSVLECGGDTAQAHLGGLEQWLRQRQAGAGRVEQLLNDLSRAEDTDLAMLLVASRQLQSLSQVSH